MLQWEGRMGVGKGRKKGTGKNKAERLFSPAWLTLQGWSGCRWITFE